MACVLSLLFNWFLFSFMSFLLILFCFYFIHHLVYSYHLPSFPSSLEYPSFLLSPSSSVSLTASHFFFCHFHPTLFFHTYFFFFFQSADFFRSLLPSRLINSFFIFPLSIFFPSSLLLLFFFLPLIIVFLIPYSFNLSSTFYHVLVSFLHVYIYFFGLHLHPFLFFFTLLLLSSWLLAFLPSSYFAFPSSLFPASQPSPSFPCVLAKVSIYSIPSHADLLSFLSPGSAYGRC